MRQHRHAARHGGQSAYQAGQRRSTGTSAEKFSTNARLPSEPTPKSKKEKPVTLARGNGRTNHRRAPSATWATARRLPDFRADAPRLENRLEKSFQTASETVSQSRLPAQGDKRPCALKSDATRIFFVPIFGTRPHQIGEQPGGVPSSRRRTRDTTFCRAARRTHFGRLPHAFAEG